MVFDIDFVQFKGHESSIEDMGMVFGINFEQFKGHERNFKASGWYLESILRNLRAMKVNSKRRDGVRNRF